MTVISSMKCPCYIDEEGFITPCQFHSTTPMLISTLRWYLKRYGNDGGAKEIIDKALNFGPTK